MLLAGRTGSKLTLHSVFWGGGMKDEQVTWRGFFLGVEITSSSNTKCEMTPADSFSAFPRAADGLLVSSDHEENPHHEFPQGLWRLWITRRFNAEEGIAGSEHCWQFSQWNRQLDFPFESWRHPSSEAAGTWTGLRITWRSRGYAFSFVCWACAWFQ